MSSEGLCYKVKHTVVLMLVIAMMACSFGSCTTKDFEKKINQNSELPKTNSAASQDTYATASSKSSEELTVENELTLIVNGQSVSVQWEKNESVAALNELVKDKPFTIQMSMYGGFEQVGSIGQSIPRNDKQMTTSAGDIVLYSGNQLVVFYGSNSWAYTKLGHIENTSAEEMKKRLGSGDVNVTISITEEAYEK